MTVPSRPRSRRSVSPVTLDGGNDTPSGNGDAAAEAASPRRTYDRIAPHFSATREHPWPEVESFVTETARDHDEDRFSLALDVGCGNGRHAELLAGVADRVVGVDASREMLGEARCRADDAAFDLALVQADAGALPLGDGLVDLAVYVAALHHLHPRERRVGSLDELARVLAPGGRALVSAWSTTHDTFADVEAATADAGFDTTVDWTLPDGERVPRYYHIYAPPEFRSDLHASRLTVHETFLESGNCYGVVGPPDGP